MEPGEALLENEDGGARDALEAVGYGQARGLEQTIDKIGFGKSSLHR